MFLSLVKVSSYEKVKFAVIFLTCSVGVIKVKTTNRMGYTESLEFLPELALFI